MLLEPTLRTLGVKFDTRTANDIMVGKPGAAQKLLYQIMVAVRGFERNNLGNDPAVIHYLACLATLTNKCVGITMRPPSFYAA